MSVILKEKGGQNLKEDLYELKEIEEKIKNKLDFIKDNTDINSVKALKNNIYEKASKTFIYNLKKLIKHEGTQKSLARKVGISEDLLSKYKAGEAFPSIETLIYICEVYKLSLTNLIDVPFTAVDLENLEDKQEINSDMFEEKYYVYFLVTNLSREGAIHEGSVEFRNNKAEFKILSDGQVVKRFIGTYNIADKLIFFNLNSSEDGTTYISMIKPNVNKNKYVGGLALMMLPSDANSKPCAQKVLFTKVRVNRDTYYSKLKELLSFSTEGGGHVKITQSEDEFAYNFIRMMDK